MTFIPAYLIAYSNSDFTNPHELVLPDDPKDYREQFTHAGAKYWGMETCRHKATSVDKVNKKIHYQYDAHNWVNIAFKERANISSVQISTKWYTGNQVRAVSVIVIDELIKTEVEVLSRVSLEPDKEHRFTFPAVTATEAYIKIYYEGGLSRINFFGEITKEQLPKRENLLASAEISHVSNEHYGNPKMAVNGCRKEMHMVGWESARTGFGEQAIFHFKQPSLINEIVVDTYLHRFNSPLTCHIYGLLAEDGKDVNSYISSLPKWMLTFEDGHEVIPDNFQQYMLDESFLKEKITSPTHFEIALFNEPNSPWVGILPHELLHADTYHRFNSLKESGPFSHLLYLHYPNGGIHGLKCY